MAYKKDWSDYYAATRSKPPRDLLVKALSHLLKKKDQKAIDIGGGALRDTIFLLHEGFDVTVLDKSPLVDKEADKIKNEKLHIFISSFEEFVFPKDEYDIASAMYALPFCNPEHFSLVMENIKQSLKIGGIFCGQFFGDRDQWSSDEKMTFLNKDQAQEIISDFETISFTEEEKDDKTAAGDTKHWHIFNFIVRKIK
jgi:hypothetical protein